MNESLANAYTNSQARKFHNSNPRKMTHMEGLLIIYLLANIQDWKKMKNLRFRSIPEWNDTKTNRVTQHGSQKRKFRHFLF